MSEPVMLEAALFQLKAAIGKVEDPMFEAQLRLSMNVLVNAVTAAADSLSPAAVNDVEFALNDVAAAVGELTAQDAANVGPALQMMQADVAELKKSMSLPAEVVAAVRALQTKLRARRAAIERQTYREAGSSEEPLPHPPEDLRAEAEPLRQKLSGAGFFTPALDELISNPSSLRFHSLGAILDELDVITG
jgi:hypothetical protein